MDNLTFLCKLNLNGKARKKHEWKCVIESMFGDESKFGSNLNGQNMPKKGQQEKIFFLYIKQGSITNSFIVKMFYILHSL